MFLSSLTSARLCGDFLENFSCHGLCLENLRPEIS
jgi:hypothetical protein